MEWAPRGFVRKEEEALTAPKINKTKLNWQAQSYQTVKMRFKFIIFSKRDGNIARYYIGTKAPDFLWTELKNKPMDVTFERCKTKTRIGCRLLRDGIPQESQPGQPTEMWVKGAD
jgi:hypothetical protein